MKPNKQFRKHQVQSILLMMVMCWASQSSAQPTRAASISNGGGDINKPFGSIGICMAIPQGKVSVDTQELTQNNYGLSPYKLSPKISASSYWDMKYPEFSKEGGTSLSPSDIEKAMHGEKLVIYDNYDFNTATWTVLQQPKHGTLSTTSSNADEVVYHPELNYHGNDKAVFLVNIDGYQIKLVYYFKVVNFEKFDYITDLVNKENCPNPRSWKISIFSEGIVKTDTVEKELGIAKGGYAIGLPAALGTYTQAPSSLLGNYSNSDYFNLSYSFTNLPSTAVGQTTGEGTAANILLDINAAGRGWYMDSTPLSNDDYLPTSNPNEWIAKAGSAAADKMDLLSALVGWVEV